MLSRSYFAPALNYNYFGSRDVESLMLLRMIDITEDESSSLERK